MCSVVEKDWADKKLVENFSLDSKRQCGAERGMAVAANPLTFCFFGVNLNLRERNTAAKLPSHPFKDKL